MQIQTKSAGILDNFSDTSVLDDRESWPVARFLDVLDRKLGNKLKDQIFCRHELREDIGILLNGRNIRILPQGLNSPLKDGDALFICVVVSGG
jgi:molybdopterin converting factor small subunit